MSNLYTAHRQWASRPSDERYETLDALAAAVSDRRLRSHARDIPLASINARPDGDAIYLWNGNKEVEPSHWSFGQLSSWIKAPADYLRRLPSDLATRNINHGIVEAAKDNPSLKFMTIVSKDDDTPNTLQAITSTTYGRIWDADVVSCATRIQERTSGKFYNPKAYVDGAIKGSGLYASDRDVFIFMIDGGSQLDIGPRAQLNRGFIMGNSEVGRSTFWITTFLFNSVCGNHIIWGAQDIRGITIKHSKNGPMRFDNFATPLLLSYANASSHMEMDAIAKAQQHLLPSNENKSERKELAMEWLRSKGKFTKTEAEEGYNFARSEEGDCRTLWHYVQGLTAYARGFEWVDARVDLETRAGRLLDIVKN